MGQNEQLRKILRQFVTAAKRDSFPGFDLIEEAEKLLESQDDGPWTVKEKLPDGSWRRHATAHAWAVNEDARQQYLGLQRRYPNKIFAVVSMAED